jgi:RimJ/RimL family protein N-acetyltransferase
VPDNLSSIKLLKKLAFKFEKKIEVEKKTLNVYNLKI